MKIDREDAVWCLAMFDLPVTTKSQRREANGFRHLLLDLGFWMAQYSVYVRYTPTADGSRQAIDRLRVALPAGGEVRVLHISDHQWSHAIRFANAHEVVPEDAPAQLEIF